MSHKRLGDNLEVGRIHPRSYSVSNRRPLRRPAMTMATQQQPVPETRVMMVPSVNNSSHQVSPSTTIKTTATAPKKLDIFTARNNYLPLSNSPAFLVQLSIKNYLQPDEQQPQQLNEWQTLLPVLLVRRSEKKLHHVLRGRQFVAKKLVRFWCCIFVFMLRISSK